MSRSKLKRPSPGTVLGTLALIVALAGNASAFSSRIVIRRGEIAPGAVTAKTIAKGAVRAKALAKGAVTARSLANGAVGSGALAANAVTANAIAPESIHGYALGPVTLHSTPIADLDQVPHNGEWTASSAESADCTSGERLLSGGVTFTNPGNREVAIITSQPVSNGAANAWVGQITSDSGGIAKAEVQAICLK